MAKKYAGSYTAVTSKVFRQSERIVCQVTDDGEIYAANGFLIFKMNAEEYAQTVQPAACCDAGNWSISSGEKKPSTMDLRRLFYQEAKAAAAADLLEPAPMTFDAGGKRKMVGMYGPGADFAAFYNLDFISCLSDASQCRSTGPLSPAVVFSGCEPIAMILPIRTKGREAEAVKAWFASPKPEKPGADDQAAQLQELLDLQNAKLISALNEVEALKARIRELEAAAQPTPSVTAETIAAHWSRFDGIAATVKGAHTASPIVWLSGATEAHAGEIEASGGKWSAKKSAYYFRVA